MPIHAIADIAGSSMPSLARCPNATITSAEQLHARGREIGAAIKLEDGEPQP